MMDGPTFADAAGRPPVLRWYRLYAGAMAALYLCVFVGGLLLAAFHETLGRSGDPPPALVLVYGAFLAVLGFIFAIPFIGAFFVPRRSWAWIFHLALITVGLSSPCCMPASIPLLLYWIKPDVRTYFGRPPA